MVAECAYGIRKGNRKVLFFVSRYQGGPNFKTIALWSIGLGVEQPFDFRQRHPMIGPRLDWLDFHKGSLSLNSGRVNFVVTRMRPNKAHIDNSEPILNRHHQPVIVALEIENDTIV